MMNDMTMTITIRMGM